MSDTQTMVVSTRNRVHFQNNVPWMYGPQNKLPPPELRQALRAGKLEYGVICGALAKLFRWELEQQGITARVVSLKRKGEEKHLVHAAVEALVDHSWQLHDPYFNCSFGDTGSRLSKEAIQRLVRSKHPPLVRFDHCCLNIMCAWRPWQKSLQWLTERVLAARDYTFGVGERTFWELLLPWLQSGHPTKLYNWKRRQYLYWEYF